MVYQMLRQIYCIGVYLRYRLLSDQINTIQEFFLIPYRVLIDHAGRTGGGLEIAICARDNPVTHRDDRTCGGDESGEQRKKVRLHV